MEADAAWAAPRQWRSELRNILATYVRSNLLELSDALQLFQRAADIVGPEEYEVETSDVLRLSSRASIQRTTASTWRWPNTWTCPS